MHTHTTPGCFRSAWRIGHDYCGYRNCYHRLPSRPLSAARSLSAAQHSLHANASWGERSGVASSINTLLSLTPCLIFPPFYHSRSLRRRLPVGGSVLPLAGRKKEKEKKAGQVVDCVFILEPRRLFVSQQSCLCFYSGLILFRKASGRNRGSHPFPLKTCHPDGTLVRSLLVCHYRPFPSWLERCVSSA